MHELKVRVRASKVESQAIEVCRCTNLILKVHQFEAQSRPLVGEDDLSDGESLASRSESACFLFKYTTTRAQSHQSERDY